MKTWILSVLAASTLLVSQAHATVLGFDDLDANGKLSSLAGKAGVYGNLVWDKNWYLGDTDVAGYGNAAHSGTNFLNNGFGVKTLMVSSAEAFDFAGAWFAAPAINGTQAGSVNISAYDAADRLIGSTGDVAITNSFIFVAAGFDGVSRLVVTRDKGFFVMDDFTLAAAAAEVPEPAGTFALGLGLAGLAVRRRRARG
jgi:hypothetical protein